MEVKSFLDKPPHDLNLHEWGQLVVFLIIIAYVLWALIFVWRDWHQRESEMQAQIAKRDAKIAEFREALEIETRDATLWRNYMITEQYLKEDQKKKRGGV